MLPSLPQFDPTPAARAVDIARERARVQLSWSTDDLPVVDRVPLAERFSAHYLAEAGRWQGRSVENVARASAVVLRSAPDGGLKVRALRALRGLQDRIKPAIDDTPPHRGPRPYDQRPPLSLADFDAMVPPGYSPEARHRWRDDRYFALQRVAGCSPCLIRRVDDRLPPHCQPDPALFAALFPGDRLEAALAEGRLYIADLRMLEGIPAGVAKGGWRRWICAPVALFVRGAQDAQLHPVCIRCAQTPSDADPLIYPTDGAAWLMARTVYQSNESIWHGVAMHGVFCHLTMGVIGACLLRTLAPVHPLHVLLRPHVQFTLPIDRLTMDLFRPGGRTPTIQGVSVDSTKELADRAWRTHRWDAVSPTRMITDRGLGDRAALPDHPFRDDGEALWDLTLRFVSGYVDLYYSSDADVDEDNELQAFVAALLNPAEGGLHGLNSDDQLRTRAALRTFLTEVIWRASTYHAVVNYGVWPSMGFIPNMPMAVYAPPPRRRSGYTEDDLLQLLPPLELALRQLDDVFVVGHLRANRLGDYPPGTFADRRARPLVAALQTGLGALEAQIEARNRARAVPYTLLLPSNVTASVHI
jgi:arachidonate 15-lipoxygenase